jgi:hypothetical protein
MDDVETSSSFESMALLDSDDKPDSSEKSVGKRTVPEPRRIATMLGKDL